MTANELYRLYLESLQPQYAEGEAAGISNMVFESVAGITRSALIKDPQSIIDPMILARMRSCLSELLANKPVQYIIGEAWFYNMKLMVNESVLIPRPETEELADAAITWLRSLPSNAIKVLEIGTGSGAIAIALKKHAPVIQLTAMDNSREALAVAAENARNQQTNIQFAEQDFLDEKAWDAMGSFQLVISNPPYIPLREKAGMDKHVTQYEPHQALFVPDEQPLLFYEKIAAFCTHHLEINGMVMLETHEDLAKEVSELFVQERYSVNIKKDLQGKNRMVLATRCH